MPPRPHPRSGYLPSLDGWRAIAILGVLMIHDLPWQIGTHTNLAYIRYGSFGVILFFAISGVLISTRILEEESLTGAFHLRSFYIRRLFRIQPAALAYHAVVAALMLPHLVPEYWHFWAGALFLYENFLYNSAPATTFHGYFTGHFWTLAVEEHFYLLISLFLFFVRRRRILILTLALIAIKAIQIIATHYTPDPLLRRTYWQIQILLFPSLAAMLLRLPRVRAAAIRWMQPVPVLLLTALAIALCHGILLPGIVRGRMAFLEIQIISYSFTFWVIATMLHPRSLVTRLLETAPLRFLGRISYSLYLWHVLFYSRIDGIPLRLHELDVLSGRPWKYVATLAVAIASYFCIEKPLIRLGHRLAPSTTTPRQNLVDQPATVQPTTQKI